MYFNGKINKRSEIRYSIREQAPHQLQSFQLQLTADQARRRAGSRFFNCTAFGNRLRKGEKYLKQGTKMVVVEEYRTIIIRDKEGQKKIFRTDYG